MNNIFLDFEGLNVSSPLATDQYIYKAYDLVIGSGLIHSYANVAFQVENSVTLFEGFQVDQQCVFLANLEGCN